MIMEGIFLRWAVVRTQDGSPTEGCVYTDRARAEKRRRGMAKPDQFKVASVYVLTQDTMQKVVEAIQ